MTYIDHIFNILAQPNSSPLQPRAIRNWVIRIAYFAVSVAALLVVDLPNPVVVLDLDGFVMAFLLPRPHSPFVGHLGGSRAAVRNYRLSRRRPGSRVR